MSAADAELLTLPKVFPIIDRAIRGGRGRPGHPGGPRLYHGDLNAGIMSDLCSSHKRLSVAAFPAEMAQHMPAGTPGGQSWHRDGDYIRCTFTLNDLGPDDGGAVRRAAGMRSWRMPSCCIVFAETARYMPTSHITSNAVSIPMRRNPCL